MNVTPLYACRMGDPGRHVDDAVAQAHAALASVRAMPGSMDKSDAAARLMREMRDVSDAASAVLRAEMLRVKDEEGLSVGRLAKRYGVSKTRAYQIIKDRDRPLAAEEAEEEDTVTEPSTTPEPPSVVAAIVTSPLGVLIARRNDGKPPWTFISGENEPGESPADTAVREVKEEAELRIRAGGVIGRRLHPKTGRLMVYVAAQPTHGTDVVIGDAEELAEIRWASLAEAAELMGGTMYEPVRQHLRHMLGNGDGTAGK